MTPPITSLQEAQQLPGVEFPVDWDPRPDQAALWDYLVNGGLRAVECAHRRWGKDDVALHWTCCAAMQTPANYWHMLPEYNQARKVVWTALNPRTGKKRIDEAFPIWCRKNTREQEMSIELISGSVWQLVGSDNYNSLVGSPPIGIVFSEWALANPLAWAYLSPILEENHGWALFIYTSRGNNHGKTLLSHAKATEGWFAEVNPADKTPVFTAKQLENIHSEYQRVFGLELGDALFLQEYFCSFEGAQLGAYYGKQIAQAYKDGRITIVPHATGLEVNTAWDLGVDDSMTIWFYQQTGMQIRFIDYYENTGYGLEHYAKILKEKPYVYGNHFMPHDADVREMTSPGEVAKSRKEVAEALGIKPISIIPRARNMDTIIQVHIPAVRNILSQCWFDEKKCATGISALEGYKAEYDEEKKVLSGRPAHDWCVTSETYLLTKFGKCQIMDLPNKGEVLTLCGWKAYQNPRITRRNAPLVEVTFSDGFTVRCTPDHLFLTEGGWKSAESLITNTVIQSSLMSLRNILTVVFIEFGRAINTYLAGAENFIEMLGRWLLAPSKKVVISIIGMETRSIISCQTLNVSQKNIIPPITTREGLQMKPEGNQQSGTVPKQEGFGIDDKLKDQWDGRNGKGNSRFVQSAAKTLWRLFANQAVPKFIVRRIANPLVVVCVKRLEQTNDVWCVSVPESEHFSLANGAIVHNCSHGADAFRTFALGYKPVAKSYDWRSKVKQGSWRAP